MQRHNLSDAYDITVFNNMTLTAPAVGCFAALTFTVAKLSGFFPKTNMAWLISFDVICVLYFLAGYGIKKMGISEGGKISTEKVYRVGYALVAFEVLQWNLISYIFPCRDFWGFAFLFVLMPTFLFKTKIVIVGEIGIGVSILVSWFINGSMLLPQSGPGYYENLIIRIIALIAGFVCVYIVGRNGESFKKQVKRRSAEIEKRNDELEQLSMEIIDFTASLVEQRDNVSGTHILRVKHYVEMLAKELSVQCPEYKITPEDIVLFSNASVMHDVGKIKISDSVLLKPGKLTVDECSAMKKHTTSGAGIIDMLPQNIDKEFRRCCRDICLYHHEKYDGKGYPYGLSGDDIPISAQITSIADCYDALTSDRPYKKAFSHEQAVEMILNGECGVFSDKLLECFKKCAADPEFLERQI